MSSVSVLTSSPAATAIRSVQMDGGAALKWTKQTKTIGTDGGGGAVGCRPFLLLRPATPLRYASLLECGWSRAVIGRPRLQPSLTPDPRHLKRK